MPQNQPTYDYTQDPEFLNASVMQQDAYLKANDPEYAAADPKTRGAYIAHIKGFDQPTQFEQQNQGSQKPYYGFTPGNLAGQAWQGAKELASGTYNLGKDILTQPFATTFQNDVAAPLEAQQQQAQQLRQQGRNTEAFGHTIASYLPFLGPAAASLGEQAGSGDIGGAAARAAGQYGAVKGAQVAAEYGGQAAGAARTAIGKASYTPEGTLKPFPQALSKLGGAFVGHLTGIPEAGIGGFLTGPQAYKALFPNPDAEYISQGKYMNAGYRPVGEPEPPEPSMIAGTPTNALAPGSQAMQLPSSAPGSGAMTTTGGAVQPTFLRMIQTGIAQPSEDVAPLRPTVGTPEEWATYEQRMKNLKAEASDAGTYSAARGKTGKTLNYQQRIGKSY